jgi:alpha-N-arabinofuranosidase
VTSVLEASTLHAGADQDRNTTNRERHDAVTPQRFDDYVLDGGQLKVSLPALSWTVFSFSASRA